LPDIPKIANWGDIFMVLKRVLLSGYPSGHVS
jgi:hypothetical protein